jgi:hypothetical protein
MDSEVTSSTPARWTHCSSGAGHEGINTEGTFYIVGKAEISHDVGTAGDPLKVTLITYGSIEVSANPILAWDDNTTTPATLNPTFSPNTMFVAGRDIKINGNPGQIFTGAFLAEEQLSISGNPNINGFFLAENNNPNISSWDTGDGTVTISSISGNPTITYNCDAGIPALAAPPTIHAWVSLP